MLKSLLVFVFTLMSAVVADDRHDASTRTTILMGSGTGTPMYFPQSVTILRNNYVAFQNSVGYPYKPVFDPIHVPAGVNAHALSAADALTSSNGRHVVFLTIPGTYTVYDELHTDTNMVCSITVL